ncbi:hypothetical protein NW754_008492 [Fusarium falciforme]|nr:hypothetical protein NW754_008492 [Fusarium falciforme]KAJ4205101.1 hypothetical protein NW767_003892 [Fusarium falciforme]KAJ4241445.1 hypothetical protein NW757_012269 [Fusarium falciforme]
MEQTFMTIHNLGPDANILYASESVIDILGYTPHEVLGRSSFDFFHPDEVPFARSVHTRGVLLDKAAVLHYARILSRDGRWVSCECCFTIVHDVLVACTSIYRRGEKSERRAIEAPQIRRIFSCSPRDPRYHMLEHLSPKFKMSPMEREPRAALILNRFTRTLTVMFATEAIASILGVSADQVQHKSFYECIRESSLDDAFKCLESAKANDSIAYLRFWSRDPRRPEDFENEASDDELDDGEDAEEEEEQFEEDSITPPRNQSTSGHGSLTPKKPNHLPESRRSSDSEGGGVKLDRAMDLDSNQQLSPQIKVKADVEMQDSGSLNDESSFESRTASSAAMASISQTDSYRTPPTPQSPRPMERSTPSLRRARSQPRQRLAPSVELEAVVSCTSDGLVVILRRARPQIPNLHPPLVPSHFDNGLFAAPWGQQPIQPQCPPEVLYNFRPPLLPQHMPLRENVKAAGGPPIDQLMRSIRDVAVFAWALVGINGNLASYSHGQPMGESQPPDGLPVWDPAAAQTSYQGPENQAAQRWARERQQQGAQFMQRDSLSTGYHADGPGSRNTSGMGYENYSLNGYGNRGNQWYSQPPAFQQSQEALAQDYCYREQMDPRATAPSDYMGTTLPPLNGWSDVHQRLGSSQVPSTLAEDPQHHRYRWY